MRIKKKVDYDAAEIHLTESPELSSFFLSPFTVHVFFLKPHAHIVVNGKWKMLLSQVQLLLLFQSPEKLEKKQSFIETNFSLNKKIAASRASSKLNTFQRAKHKKFSHSHTIT